jgi:hypothetical protein
MMIVMMMSAACFYFLLSLDVLCSDAAYDVHELEQECILFIVEIEVRANVDTLYFYVVAYR